MLDGLVQRHTLMVDGGGFLLASGNQAGMASIEEGLSSTLAHTLAFQLLT